MCQPSTQKFSRYQKNPVQPRPSRVQPRGSDFLSIQPIAHRVKPRRILDTCQPWGGIRILASTEFPFNQDHAICNQEEAFFRSTQSTLCSTKTKRFSDDTIRCFVDRKMCWTWMSKDSAPTSRCNFDDNKKPVQPGPGRVPPQMKRFSVDTNRSSTKTKRFSVDTNRCVPPRQSVFLMIQFVVSLIPKCVGPG